MTNTLKTIASLSIVSLVTLIMLEGLLQIAFLSLPDALIQQMPQYPTRYGIRYDTQHGAREYPAHEAVNLTVTPLAGDLYQISCLSPQHREDFAPYPVRYTRDAHGFRNQEPWPQRVHTVIVGDSFTAAETIQRPYWQGLSEGEQLVLGLPGSGSLEQLRLLEAYGLPRQPQRVIMAYFGGNDIMDSWRLHQTWQRGETLQPQPQAPWDLSVLFHIGLFVWQSLSAPPAQDCPYPIRYDGRQLAFFDAFDAFAGLNAEDLREDLRFTITERAISRAATQTQAIGAEFVLVYMPYKAQVYAPLLPDGLPDDPQIEVLRALAEEQGFNFVSLLPAFREAARQGQQTYFFADTHWNQAGHDLARATLRAHLRAR